MATCKDCVHYKLCLSNSIAYGFKMKVCSKFKNKSNFQEVKHGEWVAVPSSDMSTGKAYKCSECKKMRYGVRLPPYCQECGAKMDGGKSG